LSQGLRLQRSSNQPDLREEIERPEADVDEPCPPRRDPWAVEPGEEDARRDHRGNQSGGHVIGGGGVANWGGALRLGDISQALWGTGLTNPLGADVHLIVHSHGPAIPKTIASMIHSFGGGCSNVPPGTGAPGPNECVDLQFSAYEA
jgi:hypothetical protein